MTDEQLLLATAYVDGELAVSERARVENDPQVWAEVQRQRSVQQLAQAIPPYSQATAQAQIAAAIASAHPNTTSQPNNLSSENGGGKVIQLGDRRRRAAWIGGTIAAGLLLAVAGIALLAPRGSSDSSVSMEASDEAGYATTADVAADPTTDDGDKSYDSEAVEDNSYTENSIASATASPNPPATEGTLGSADLGSSGPLAFDDPGELVEVGRVLLAKAALSLLEPSTSSCEVLSESGDSLPVLADAIYGDDDPRPVVIAVDLSGIVEEQFVVYAADPLSCDVIMSAQGSFER